MGDMKTQHFNFNEIASFNCRVCVCLDMLSIPTVGSALALSSPKAHNDILIIWLVALHTMIMVPFFLVCSPYPAPTYPSAHPRLIHDDDVMRRMFECKSKTIWMIIHSRLRCLPPSLARRWEVKFPMRTNNWVVRRDVNLHNVIQAHPLVFPHF